MLARDVFDMEVVLNSGRRMPLLGFGTYQIPESMEGRRAVQTAINAGYRLIDCASFYKNEKLIGSVVESNDRASLFIVSKVWNDAIFAGPEAVTASCLQSITDLRCGYLDLYLIHWPVPGKHVEAFRELIRLRDAGLVRDIGVSNYTIEDFEELRKAGIGVIPAVNQIEINPLLYRKTTIQYFRSNGVVPMSFRGLRNATALDNPVLNGISTRLGVTVPQLLGRWLVQRGICHIPKSINPERIHENCDVFSFIIPDEDMEALDSLTEDTSLAAFREHYLARIVRDTPIPVPHEKVVSVE